MAGWSFKLQKEQKSSAKRTLAGIFCQGEKEEGGGAILNRTKVFDNWHNVSKISFFLFAQSIDSRCQWRVNYTWHFNEWVSFKKMTYSRIRVVKILIKWLNLSLPISLSLWDEWWYNKGPHDQTHECHRNSFSIGYQNWLQFSSISVVTEFLFAGWLPVQRFRITIMDKSKLNFAQSL
jgi:hypothetical protein